MLRITRSLDPTARRAFRAPAAWATLLIVFALGLAADLASKSWTFNHVLDQPVPLDREILLGSPDFNPVAWHDGKPILPGGILELKLVLNPGAVFGVGARHRLFFIAFTFIAVAAGLLVFGRYTSARDRLAHVAIALVLAGGVGNLYDRVVFGRVRDFLHIGADSRLPFGWTWPGTNNPELMPWVFNIADVLLLTGMILLMVHVNRAERRRREREKAMSRETDSSPAASSV
jgi:signal peptidase II